MKTLLSRPALPLALLSVLAVLTYLLVGGLATGAGFPLDDAWIHQVFARNLAWRGEFAYNPGQPVAGSTSPLWTLLLVPGHWLPGSFLAWTYALGSGLLALTALECYRLAGRLSGRRTAAWAAGLLAVFEWRMVWAAASGMETLLFSWISLLLIRRYLESRRSKVESPKSEVQRRETRDKRREAEDGPADALLPAFRLGLLGGVLTLARPEGMVLPALIALDIGWQRRGRWSLLAAEWSRLGLGWLAAALPYFLLNLLLSGSPLPNTFGAKSGYYLDSSPAGLLGYIGGALYQLFLAGTVLILLTPGLLYCFWLFRTGRLEWRGLVWPASLFILYAWRLPVTYHHARYLMPVIPLLLVYGVIGTVGLVDLLRYRGWLLLARAVPLLVALAALAAWYNGALTYRFDVKYINDEQVAVGRWLAANTPPGATVATHDIGAITFFGGRRLVDTAGLVSPEFIPMVRDEAALLRQVRRLQVDYFALLPTWYPRIYAELEQAGGKVFQPQETYLAQFGEQNMAVFKLR